MKLIKILFYIIIISLIFSIGKTFGDDKAEYEELSNKININCGKFYDERKYELDINELYDKCEFEGEVKKYEFFNVLNKKFANDYNERYENILYLSWYYRIGKGTKVNYHKHVLLQEELLEFKINNPKIGFTEPEQTASNLGYVYSIYPGVRNYKKSKKYYLYAANKNEPYAINNLAYGGYQEGRVVEKDLKKAFELFKKSAKLGNHWSNGNIANFYLLGFGGAKKNYTRAINHFKLSQIENYGTGNFSDLYILFEKKRLPKTKQEYFEWKKEHLNLTKEKEIYHIVDIAHYANTILNDYVEAYKWFYICNSFPDEKDLNIGSETEKDKCSFRIILLEEEYLAKHQIKEAKIDAKDWIKKNMN